MGRDPLRFFSLFFVLVGRALGQTLEEVGAYGYRTPGFSEKESQRTPADS
jgi:hypothetical protein